MNSAMYSIGGEVDNPSQVDGENFVLILRLLIFHFNHKLSIKNVYTEAEIVSEPCLFFSTRLAGAGALQVTEPPNPISISLKFNLQLGPSQELMVSA